MMALSDEELPKSRLRSLAPYLVYAIAGAIWLLFGLWAAWWWSLGGLMTGVFALHEAGRTRAALQKGTDNGA
jgi:uncharacterized membrane protein YdjX (TVP38/TMEM64 family)